MGKLTWTHYGLVLFAGLVGFACSQEAREPVEVGAAQVELRSELILPESPNASTTLLADENPNHSDQSITPMPVTQRITLSGLESYSQDRAYGAIKRYEFLPTLLVDAKTRNSSAQEGDSNAHSSPLADKQWVRAGKGFGVGAEGMAPSGTVHIYDAKYYSSTVALKIYSKASEHLEPMAEPFKSAKPLVFHSRATGFAHELPEEAAFSGHSPVFEDQRELSPIPETQVYFSSQPKTKVTLAPAKNRLDLMNGNKNLNRHRFDKLP